MTLLKNDKVLFNMTAYRLFSVKNVQVEIAV